MTDQELLDEKKIKEATLKMFRETLGEIVEKNAGKGQIDLVIKEIGNIERDIQEIDKACRKKSEEYRDTYKNYDKAGKSLYDAIDKHGNDKDNDNDVVSSLPTNERLGKKANDDDGLKEAADEKLNIYDDPLKEVHAIQDKIADAKWVKQNNFLVTLPLALGIPKYAIKSVSERTEGKILDIVINDFVDEKGPVRKRIDNFIKKSQDSPETVIIEYLDDFGKHLYSQVFTGINLNVSYADLLNYSKSEIRLIHLPFRYENYSFE